MPRRVPANIATFKVTHDYGMFITYYDVSIFEQCRSIGCLSLGWWLYMRWSVLVFVLVRDVNVDEIIPVYVMFVTSDG